MKKKLQKVLAKVLGLDQRTPIVDDYKYYFDGKSYAGGSLSDSNILIVSNVKDTRCIENELEKEGVTVSKIELEKDTLDLNIINGAQAQLIGPYTHIFNMLQIGNETDIFSDSDPLRNMYQWLQIEADYLVELGQTATVCVALVSDSDTCSIVANSIEGMIKGLSETLGRHSILINGIYADESVPMECIVKWMSFLSSKYGHILTGNFLQLSLG